ncbi:hypothetical protein HNR61_000535 [Actinomadura namibiensis]|uniref:Uncharacterized protein n=1 Tax=Actinomadura namibiensis TaxID=182080 RepID=A0A7W3LIS5_ACTNM|nr:hypothetical protein [Actinomadura namibiensis]
MLDREVLEAAAREGAHYLLPGQVEIVAEVTPWSGPDATRPPTDGRISKWTACARAGIPHHLLIDRHADEPRTTPYSAPDSGAGTYGSARSRAFGEVVVLPEPFSIEIDSARWSRCGGHVKAEMEAVREALPRQGR